MGSEDREWSEERGAGARRRGRGARGEGRRARSEERGASAVMAEGRWVWSEVWKVGSEERGGRNGE